MSGVATPFLADPTMLLDMARKCNSELALIFFRINKVLRLALDQEVTTTLDNVEIRRIGQFLAIPLIWNGQGLLLVPSHLMVILEQVDVGSLDEGFVGHHPS